MISAFDLFKIDLGPSSSHTMGPMIAAKRFRNHLSRSLPDCARIEVTLFGSLAWTARGHGADQAICLGLLGEEPQRVDPGEVAELLNRLSQQKRIVLEDGRDIAFDPGAAISLELTTLLARHTNAMRFRALSAAGIVLDEQTFYSIGGGFVVEDGEEPAIEIETAPYPFRHSSDLLRAARETGLSIAELQMANERMLRSEVAIERGLNEIAAAMFHSIDRGLSGGGELPGGLMVKRRARSIGNSLLALATSNEVLPHNKLEWVSVYALAVNEENAAGGRVVTAPTNGAAGIVPAILRYYREFYPNASTEGIRTFLLTATAIGALIKSNASISGAEVGCQGEVGSAAAMAAAGLAAVSGATPAQIENAAEIALEHHLGLTCDPLRGLVQVPCIERNAIGAQKAIAAASLALRGDGSHRVTLDEVIETMRQTGLDMQEKYKETSKGGLAVNVAEC